MVQHYVHFNGKKIVQCFCAVVGTCLVKWKWTHNVVRMDSRKRPPKNIIDIKEQKLKAKDGTDKLIVSALLYLIYVLLPTDYADLQSTSLSPSLSSHFFLSSKLFLFTCLLFKEKVTYKRQLPTLPV